MPRAPGLGKFGGTTPVKASAGTPGIIYATLSRLPADGGVPAGGLDADGRNLHLRYKASRVLQTSAPVNTPNEIEIEFDGGVHVLPWCGFVEVTGGSGNWSWAISSEPLPGSSLYFPRLHTLQTHVPRAGVFTVPANHTWIGSWNGLVNVTDVTTGEVMRLSATPVPVVPGSLLTVPTSGVTLFTAWEG